MKNLLKSILCLVYQKHYDEDLIIEGIAKAVGTCQDLAKFSVLLSQICQPFAKILLGLYENYEKSLIESKEVFDKVLNEFISF